MKQIVCGLHRVIQNKKYQLMEQHPSISLRGGMAGAFLRAACEHIKRFRHDRPPKRRIEIKKNGRIAPL